MAIDHDLVCACDLGLDEVRRRSAILDAIGGDRDLVQALTEEEQAYRMLYSGLDDTKQRATASLLPRECCRIGRMNDPADFACRFQPTRWCAAQGDHGAGCPDYEDNRAKSAGVL